jgi:hypothetical protein
MESQQPNRPTKLFAPRAKSEKVINFELNPYRWLIMQYFIGCVVSLHIIFIEEILFKLEGFFWIKYFGVLIIIPFMWTVGVFYYHKLSGTLISPSDKD